MIVSSVNRFKLRSSHRRHLRDAKIRSQKAEEDDDKAIYQAWCSSIGQPELNET